jgi:hypothetical protein
MGSATEYRKRAQECVELAQHLRASERPKMLKIAEAWLKLADEAAEREATMETPPAHKGGPRPSN